MVTDLVHYILGLRGWLVVAVVFVVPMLESSAFVGFVFPGEIAVLLGGVLASQHQANLAAVLLAAACGAVLGDAVGYAVGRRWGLRVVHGVLGRFVRHAHLARGERFLAERGGKAVFFGRFTAALRVVMPGLAGMAHMPYRTFAVYNVTGGVAWATVTGLLGYLAGASWPYVAHLASRVGLVVFVLLAAGVGVSLVMRTFRQRPGWPHAFIQWLVTTRASVWLRHRFPAQLNWLGRRLDPNAPSGLGLTVTVLVAVLSAWLFAGVTQDVLAQEEFVRVDPVIEAAVVAHRTSWVTAGMQVVTWLGSSVVLVPVMLVAAVFMTGAKRDIRAAAGLWVAYLGAVGLYSLVKALVDRPRPAAMNDLVHATGASFPSGHATQALVVWGMLTALLIRGRVPRARTAAVAGSVLLVLLIGASRVYLGAHWLTDVIGGFALGGMWLALVLALGRKAQVRTAQCTVASAVREIHPAGTKILDPDVRQGPSRGR